jgi:hypothetical protein
MHWLRNVAEPVAVLPARSRRVTLPPLASALARSFSCPPMTPELST